MSDADTENSDTQISLDFALECNYINKEKHNKLIIDSEEVGKMLNSLINNPEKFKPK